jgi:hypothetical protein
MWYAYRVNDAQDWVKLKEFETLKEYQAYIEKRKIMTSMCCNFEVDLRGKALITWPDHP